MFTACVRVSTLPSALRVHVPCPPSTRSNRDQSSFAVCRAIGLSIFGRLSGISIIDQYPSAPSLRKSGASGGWTESAFLSNDTRSHVPTRRSAEQGCAVAAVGTSVIAIAIRAQVRGSD